LMSTGLMKRGRLIVFSGLDGAGKSTQIRLLMERLESDGCRPVCLWTRGGYTSGFNALKSALRRLSRGRALPESGHTRRRARAFKSPATRRAWLRLALLDLIRVYAVQVRLWLWRGRTIICDRYLWDTLVDFRLNFPLETVEESFLWRALARLTPRPDAAFLMLVPVEESVRRSDIKGEPFRDPVEVLEERLSRYEALATEGHWHVLDGRRAAPDLASDILSKLDERGRRPRSLQTAKAAD
jgi:thymidylate kinase